MAHENLEDSINHVVKYFIKFNYPPTFEEIYTYVSFDLSHKALQNELGIMISNGKLTTESGRYTLPGYGIILTDYLVKAANSGNKYKIVNKFTSVIKLIPLISFIGVSGSLSMNNSKEQDDIDIFIITQKNRLWTGRFLTSLITSFLGMKRDVGLKRNSANTKDKICLNLFFDSKNLQVPESKKNEYVAHEILQLKPIVNKQMTYEFFLNANHWLYSFFPNAKQLKNKPSVQLNNKIMVFSVIGDTIELVLKIFQLKLINRHKTTEIITDTQLWFFPDDYEKKMK